MEVRDGLLSENVMSKELVGKELRGALGGERDLELIEFAVS